MKRTPHQVLEEIAKIRRMERGKVVLNQSKGGRRKPFYNRNTYENGKSRTYYVRQSEVEDYKLLTANHQKFRELVAEYEDLVIAETRAEGRLG